MDTSEVEKLAQTLKKQGLAASMTDALEKARSIIGSPQKASVQEDQEEDDDITTSEKTINELLSELGLDADEQAPAQQQPTQQILPSDTAQITDKLESASPDIGLDANDTSIDALSDASQGSGDTQTDAPTDTKEASSSSSSSDPAVQPESADGSDPIDQKELEKELEELSNLKLGDEEPKE